MWSFTGTARLFLNEDPSYIEGHREQICEPDTQATYSNVDTPLLSIALAEVDRTGFWTGPLNTVVAPTPQRRLLGHRGTRPVLNPADDTVLVKLSDYGRRTNGRRSTCCEPSPRIWTTSCEEISRSRERRLPDHEGHCGFDPPGRASPSRHRGRWPPTQGRRCWGLLASMPPNNTALPGVGPQ